jgi:tight adherence protein B
MLIATACFVGLLGLFIGAYWLFVLRPEDAAQRELHQRLSPTTVATTEALEREPLLRRVVPRTTLPALERTFERFGHLVRPIERLLGRSGWRLTVGQLVLGCTFAGALGFVASMQLVNAPSLALGAAILVGALPFALLHRAASRRLAKFEAHFPEAIDLIARALRAGHALTTGLGMVAEEAPEPVRTEFQLLHHQQRYGMPLSDAMLRFADRVPLLASRFFVTAVLTQREAGGDLAEVLDTLAALIRDRFRLKRQIQVMSAHGRITAAVLCGLPVVLGAILFVTAPTHIATLLIDPLGIRMAVAALVLQAVGFVVMRRIVRFQI